MEHLYEKGYEYNRRKIKMNQINNSNIDAEEALMKKIGETIQIKVVDEVDEIDSSTKKYPDPEQTPMDYSTKNDDVIPKPPYPVPSENEHLTASSIPDVEKNKETVPNQPTTIDLESSNIPIPEENKENIDPMKTSTNKPYKQVSLFEFKATTFERMVDLIKDRDILELEIDSVRDNLDHVSYDKVTRFPTNKYAKEFFKTRTSIQELARLRKAEYIRGSPVKRKSCYEQLHAKLFRKLI